MPTSPKNPLCFFASPLLRVKLLAFKLKCRNADWLKCSIAAAAAKNYEQLQLQQQRKNQRLQQQQIFADTKLLRLRKVHNVFLRFAIA